MKKFISFLIVLFACVTLANAAKDSGPFYIKGGIIAPKQQFELDLKLDDFSTVGNYAVFDIKCFIENPNHAKPYPVVLKMTFNTYGQKRPSITLNNRELNENQGRLD